MYIQTVAFDKFGVRLVTGRVFVTIDYGLESVIFPYVIPAYQAIAFRLDKDSHILIWRQQYVISAWFG